MSVTVLSIESAWIPGVLADLRARHGQVRYYLSAGRPVWLRPEDDTTDLSTALLRCHDDREARLRKEVSAVRSWLAEGGERAVVVEMFGAPTHDDVRFLQECRMRLVRGEAQSVTVLRHVLAALPVEGDEILAMLKLAGGAVPEREFQQWQAQHGWDEALVHAVTSTRDGLRTWAAPVARPLPITPELAAEVATTSRVPLETAALITDPVLALRAFTAGAAAEAAGRGRVLSRYAGNLYRRALKTGAIPHATAAAAYLAALVADRRRVSGPLADVVLRQAARWDVAPDHRAMLAYSLGQLLAKDPDPAQRASAARCFAHARELDVPLAQVAASFNGAALALYRDRDLTGAVTTMRTALDLLEGHDTVADQQVQLLTNLAKLRRGTPEAVGLYRRAWGIADDVANATYVAADLVRVLLEAGERPEAEAVATRLLELSDRAEDTGQATEKAVSAVCFRLADQHLADGATAEAGRWYLAGISRMRRGAPDVVDAVMRNLGEQPAALLEQRAAHALVAGDLLALRGLLAGAA
ncbi:hypothetical protein [Lentzea sp. NBRC 102530]|uniref:hypothetical protein n=1 Tax=Lentzea sp. NBRC 102530 TaxID=3032201 RepID=UPI0024A36DEA|nr:hypothetical protein [Lentzea sp. NBRC 102530]GLY47558.1 hypothetical protein Lesp01_12140 [Lentzea sp. NBRC 102530]